MTTQERLLLDASDHLTLALAKLTMARSHAGADHRKARTEETCERYSDLLQIEDRCAEIMQRTVDILESKDAS